MGAKEDRAGGFRQRSTEDEWGGCRWAQGLNMALKRQRRGNVSLVWSMRCQHRPDSVQWSHTSD